MPRGLTSGLRAAGALLVAVAVNTLLFWLLARGGVASPETTDEPPEEPRTVEFIPEVEPPPVVEQRSAPPELAKRMPPLPSPPAALPPVPSAVTLPGRPGKWKAGGSLFGGQDSGVEWGALADAAAQTLTEEVRPEPPPRKRVYSAREVDVPPKPRRAPAPRYPRSAEREGIQGKVVLEFVVTASGRVRDVRVVEAFPKAVFESAARAAVLGWTFEPAKKAGRSVDVRVRKSWSFGR